MRLLRRGRGDSRGLMSFPLRELEGWCKSKDLDGYMMRFLRDMD